MLAPEIELVLRIIDEGYNKKAIPRSSRFEQSVIRVGGRDTSGTLGTYSF